MAPRPSSHKEPSGCRIMTKCSNLSVSPILQKATRPTITYFTGACLYKVGRRPVPSGPGKSAEAGWRGACSLSEQILDKSCSTQVRRPSAQKNTPAGDTQNCCRSRMYLLGDQGQAFSARSA